MGLSGLHPLVGLAGAAWSTFASVLLIVGWRVLFLQTKFHLWPFDRMTLRAVAVISAMAMLLGFLPHYGGYMLDIAWRTAPTALATAIRGPVRRNQVIPAYRMMFVTWLASLLSRCCRAHREH